MRGLTSPQSPLYNVLGARGLPGMTDHTACRRSTIGSATFIPQTSASGACGTETYAATDPGYVTCQIDLVLCLFKLALASDEPRARLERGLTIMRKLEGGGRLTAAQKTWIGYLEEALKSLPN